MIARPRDVALMAPATTAADVDRHSEVFAEAVGSSPADAGARARRSARPLDAALMARRLHVDAIVLLGDLDRA